MATKESKKTVEVLTHDDTRRKHIPITEYQSVIRKAEKQPVRVTYEHAL